MKKFGIALALGLGLAAAPASAVTISLGTVNALPGGFAGGSFDGDAVDSKAGFTGQGLVKHGTNSNQWAAPYADGVGSDDTNYYVVGPSTGTATPYTATLAASNLSSVSFYWGSIDHYNSISFDGTGVSFNGDGSTANGATAAADFRGGASDAMANRLVTFYFTPTEAAALTGITFASTENAFEFDNLVLGSAVPEPSVWAMMMMGLGLVGAALRRRASAMGGAFGLA